MNYCKNLPSLNMLLIILAVSALVILDGCSLFDRLANRIKKPSISVEDVRVTDFNFKEMELTYDIKVKNPNKLPVRMLAYDYNLDINENMLVQGKQQEQLNIKASDESRFQIPMRLSFSDIYKTVESLKNSDEASYDFLSHLTFNLPVLGKTELSVRKQGNIPILKMPKIRLADWSVSDVNFSSAKVMLQLEFENPNGFDIKINNLNYDLMVNGEQWAEGTTLEGAKIKKNDVTELDIPISLNMSQMGMSAYRILTGSQRFDYRIKGNFNLNPLHKLLGQTTFDFDRSGELSLH